MGRKKYFRPQFLCQFRTKVNGSFRIDNRYLNPQITQLTQIQKHRIEILDVFAK